MAEYDFLRTEKRLIKELDDERFQHSLGVMFTSASLAMAHDYDMKAAQMAGLLHDCAKCIPNKKKLKICEDNKIYLTDFEKDHPFLIHAKLGAFLAERNYGIKDQNILSAITYHTTGRPAMTLPEKIVYIADYIEPMRCKAPRLDIIRRLAFADLDECIYEIMKDSVAYLDRNPKDMDMSTLEAYKYYKKLHDTNMILKYSVTVK